MSQYEQIQAAAGAAFDAVNAEIRQKMKEIGEQKGMRESFNAFTAAVDWKVRSTKPPPPPPPRLPAYALTVPFNLPHLTIMQLFCRCRYAAPCNMLSLHYTTTVVRHTAAAFHKLQDAGCPLVDTKQAFGLLI